MDEKSTANSTTLSSTPTKTTQIAATLTPLLKPLPNESEQKRRSSSRSIKRKRFDDEIVEYSNTITRGSSEQGRRPNARTAIAPSLAAAAAQLPLAHIPAVTQIQNNLGAAAANTIDPVITSGDKSIGDITIKNEISSASVVGTPNLAATETPLSTLSTVATSQSISASTQLVTSAASGMDRSYGAASSVDRRRNQRSNNPRKNTRKSGRPSTMVSTKDLGRWKPIDDLALIIGVQQTNDLRMIHRGIKFSCKFSLQELQSRWFSLLYDPSISRIAVAAMRNLHPEMVASVQRKALFSTQEEEILGTIKSSDNPKLEQFQELLEKQASIFYCSRSAKSLQNHWQLLKQYQLLPDQIVKPLHVSDQPLSFSDAEDLILDTELNEPRDEAIENELTLYDRVCKKEIRLLENELTRWNVLVDSIKGANVSPEFDGQTLAVLRGRLVRYLMRSKEITFGRDAKDCTVDVDLSLEGPAVKISRRQGTIKLRSNGDFFIANEGKRPIFINGVPLLAGSKTRLGNNCVLEICGLRFVFLVNYELISAIRQESAKTTTALN